MGKSYTVLPSLYNTRTNPWKHQLSLSLMM
jgi:hypothetical protein